MAVVQGLAQFSPSQQDEESFLAFFILSSLFKLSSKLFKMSRMRAHKHSSPWRRGCSAVILRPSRQTQEKVTARRMFPIYCNDHKRVQNYVAPKYLSFLVAVRPRHFTRLQSHARRYQLPFDQPNFSFIIKAMEGPEDAADAPADGVCILASTLRPGAGIGDNVN